jgi:hypothetical protein
MKLSFFSSPNDSWGFVNNIIDLLYQIIGLFHGKRCFTFGLWSLLHHRPTGSVCVVSGQKKCCQGYQATIRQTLRQKCAGLPPPGAGFSSPLCGYKGN